MSMFKVIKDFLEPEDFKALKSFLISEDVEWHYHPKTDPKTDKEWFNHCFFTDNNITSHAFKLVQPVIQKLEGKAIIRIRANLDIRNPKIYQCSYHTDYPFECKTAILYMTDCNGGTQFKNPNKKVLCKENQIVIFDSQTQHSAITQTDAKQKIVLNINYF
jgi:hypothetical protein